MILLPTKNRIELLKRFLGSLKATGTRVGGVVIADEADYKAHLGDYDDIAGSLLPGWSLKVGEEITMGDKIRKVYRELRESRQPKDFRWVGILNDDHVCVTDNWDQIVEGLIDGTNMVSSNDGFWNFGVRVAGITAWSIPLLDACGFDIFPRRLQHLYIDDVWKSIGVSTGCWHETMKINIEHRHTFKGEMGKDETHDKVYAPSSWEHDSKEYKLFMEQDFKDVVARVARLRETQSFENKF